MAGFAATMFVAYLSGLAACIWFPVVVAVATKILEL
jgi:hypothetical protein